ncbi:MAG: hypothetical protein MJZ34_14890, partial [Paludibacteraceae bacterium]|nr:hypothetical protein [Paludibacteraceae bacterium]
MFRFFENNKFIGKMSKVAKSVALAFAIILPLGNAMAETSVTYCVNGDRKVNVYADSGYSSYYFSLNGGPKIYAGASATFAFEMPAGFEMPAEGSIKVYGGETELSVTVKSYTITASITPSNNTDGTVKLTAASTMGITGDAVVTYSWYLFDLRNNDAIKTAVDAHNKATAFGYTKLNIGTSAEIASQTIKPCGQWVALVLENKGCCYDTTFAFVVPQPICPAGFKTTETLTTTSTATDCKASGLTIPTFNACSYAWKKGSQSGTGSTGVSDLLFSDGESITWTLTNGTASTTKTQTCTTTVSIKDATAPLCPTNTTRTHTDVCTLSKNDITTEIKGIVSGYATGLDNCTSNDALSVSVTDALELKANGEKTYSYTIADAKGNFVTCEQTIKIEIADFTVPQPDPVTVSCLGDAVKPSSDLLPNITVLGDKIEPQGPTSYTIPTVGGYNGCEGKVQYIYTYTDCAGHSHEWVYEYNVSKPSVPSVKEDKEWPVSNTAIDGCYASIPTFITNVEAADIFAPSCGKTISVESEEKAGTLTSDCNWSKTMIYTITDGCNSFEKEITYAGKDQTAPVLTGTWPSDII